LFSLLRECRTGSLRLDPAIHANLAARARQSGHWLVRREATNPTDLNLWPHDPRGRHEAFRRLRDRRVVQIALDIRDIDHAVTIAEAAAAAGADLIEVGDPLIKTVGVAAIERIKKATPHTAVVAEMMSADWGRDQVVLAAESGADVVLLIGPASTASVSAAVDAGRRLGIPIVLDVPHGRLDQTWVHAMERCGVDGFAITTNIDLGVAGPQPLHQHKYSGP
jgi:3-keto-L-gulonate-6-phosphate decarboxylase